MPDLKDLNNIYLIAAFIIPGLIISYMRSRFITGRMEKFSDAALGYLTLTLVYYGFALPLVGWILTFEQGPVKTLLWWSLLIAGPVVFGLVLGVATQREWLRWIANKLRLRMVHNTPTSWDWRFSNCQNARFVMVTLSDGSSVAGIFGTGSFASTDPAERDIYIEELMDVGEDGSWSYREEPAGVLILAKEIRYIEFKKEL
ncbi:UNVERIFIED_ORG: uncharacterized membrane protein YbhN (UPF0104 family) [Methylobacterium sp. SuP10 SLI 274]|uniref:DUF6338 family protein n=1 Tax=Methylorubrum extorquens TaxID=408 RepID=UPI00209D4A85|nr:DUF6338 family protein [Methylorubrum extorquens]MDF9866396.1 uncharacterized membrane protein YbhN (UPF0104 family) [Methylorubrum pseudosasae]MDH6640158.1 uncharacterized membrane protein YbhN (UPF0104 family) [Methylobacterium sp. SuP10 SLI 274]MDH6669333.1 uncharacterized membrane protein YbhN (UPF0104 family) [Methylorubrum zatmanii]MCP1561891.1 uncharacterized membrane protein YbhN (UPF0104 family) [Methylorubrum extorquens]MDF9794703.1 uncharacterized membrane protein YbhN (UPF0104 f